MPVGSYDFELAFTGLFALTFKGKDREHPDEVEVALIKTSGPQHGHHHGAGGSPPHRPLLSYMTETLADASAHKDQVFPAPNGHLVAVRDLTRQKIRIVPPTGGPTKLKAIWRPSSAGTPPQVPDQFDEAEEMYLDWLPSFQKLAPNAPSSFHLPRKHVAGTVRFSAGKLFAAEVARKINGKYVLWDFKQKGKFDPRASQAIADLIILRMENLKRPVKIEGHSVGDLFLSPSLRPGRGQQPGLVQASVTNLPTVDSALSDTLHHFSFLDRILPSPFQVPEARNGLLDCSSSTICPGVKGG